MASEIPYNENAAFSALMYVIYNMPDADGRCLRGSDERVRQ